MHTAANNRPQQSNATVFYTSTRLAACDVLAGARFTGEEFKEIGKVTGLVVGPLVTAGGIATAQPEILAAEITVTVVGGVAYVGGAALKGVSNIALQHRCPGLF